MEKIRFKAFPQGGKFRQSHQGQAIHKNAYQDKQIKENPKFVEGRYTKNFFKHCEQLLKDDGYVFIPAPTKLPNIKKMNKFTLSTGAPYSYFDCDEGRIVYLGNIVTDNPNHPGFVFMRENNFKGLEAYKLLPEC